MKITIVIPNWNGADLLANCLRSAQAQTIPTEIVVVDNGSVDNSVELIESQFPHVTLLKNPVNLGFAGGVNTGIEYALEHGTEAIALLNNDAIPDVYWLDHLAGTLEHNDHAGIVTSKIMRSDKKHLDSTGDFYSAWGTAFPRGRDELDIGKYDKTEAVFAASGGASLYRAKMLREVGLFDEDFFAYYEDVDLSFRARLQGWEILYQPKAVVYHEVGATSSKVHDFGTYHGLKNIFFLSYKNLPMGLFIKQLPKRTLYLSALHAYAWRRGKGLSSLRASAQIIRLLPKMTRARHNIQKSRKLSPADVNNLIYHDLPPSTKRKLSRKS